MNLLFVSAILAVVYGLYIAGWLLYVRQVKKCGGNNSITVNEDGSLNLKKGGFIWKMVRFTYLLDRFYGREYDDRYKNCSMWDGESNLCPIGAKFLYGLTLFPLVVLPLGILGEGLIVVIVSGFAVGNSLCDLVGWLWKKIHPTKKATRQPVDYTIGGYDDIDSELPPPLTLYQRLARLMMKVLELIGDFFAYSLPTGPKLFNGLAFYDTKLPWLALVGIFFIGTWLAIGLVALVAAALAWILYGQTILYPLEIMCVSPLLVITGFVVCIWAYLGVKNNGGGFIGHFLSAWWKAKHGSFCPPVHFVD